MLRQPAPALARAVFALLALAAIVVQLQDLAAKGVLNPVNFFSYFTIQSNLIGIAAFLAVAARWRTGRTAALDLVRGGAVLYLTVTFVVFTLLLSGTDVDTAIPWVNSVLHGVFPIVVILDWVLAPPRAPIPFRRSLVWLSYPLVWVAYTLVRGPIAGWYPYPFLDPANGGYGSVAAYVVAILVFGIALCAVISGIGRWLGGRQVAGRPRSPAVG
jgi:hypothetical protein